MCIRPVAAAAFVVLLSVGTAVGAEEKDATSGAAFATNTKRIAAALARHTNRTSPLTPTEWAVVDRQTGQPPSKSYRKGVIAGAVTGAAVGALYGTVAVVATDAEEGYLPGAAVLGASVEGASGAVAGLALNALPRRRGWRRHLQAVAVGMASSGAVHAAVGKWLFGTATTGLLGLATGALTGSILERVR